MESQSQNPEFRNNPENFHPCIDAHITAVILHNVGGVIQKYAEKCHYFHNFDANYIILAHDLENLC